ncbi:hypothetical protein PAXRUDRAFT_537607 [Paxillus rubicundulus Ve08.2h10]|uniref:Uncharacterized protein n=1 Tax=Paxillus rubicundulus Ve08.2h10 TaxID=930991 RepID=A0A0D0E056_9AGAM|nr:hypothetical protein PAXRUDRAFT_537607 [Paxillus rubicundulus Ve08.2h10]
MFPSPARRSTTFSVDPGPDNQIWERAQDLLQLAEIREARRYWEWSGQPPAHTAQTASADFPVVNTDRVSQLKIPDISTFIQRLSECREGTSACSLIVPH